MNKYSAKITDDIIDSGYFKLSSAEFGFESEAQLGLENVYFPICTSTQISYSIINFSDGAEITHVAVNGSDCLWSFPSGEESIESKIQSIISNLSANAYFATYDSGNSNLYLGRVNQSGYKPVKIEIKNTKFKTSKQAYNVPIFYKKQSFQAPLLLTSLVSFDYSANKVELLKVNYNNSFKEIKGNFYGEVRNDGTYFVMELDPIETVEDEKTIIHTTIDGINDTTAVTFNNSSLIIELKEEDKVFAVDGTWETLISEVK